MKRNLFNVEIMETVLDGIDNDKLAQWIEQEGESYDLPAGHSVNEDTSFPRCEEMDKVIDAAVSTCVEQINLDVIPRDFWAQVHEKGMSTNTHAHLPADISGVYYVKVPEGSGVLAFVLETDHLMPEIVEPKEGKLVLFPSWLSHYVTRNQSDERRISVSFNMSIVGPANINHMKQDDN